MFAVSSGPISEELNTSNINAAQNRCIGPRVTHWKKFCCIEFPLLTSEIRAALPTDEPFLRQMLYLALFVPPGAARLPRSILRDRAISKYVDHWGTQIGDSGLLVIINGKQAGAAWLRCFPASDPGYGFVDSKTPELSVALLPGYRGMGIGMQLDRKSVV